MRFSWVLVILLAFGMRLHDLSAIRQNEDRAIPHGQGIAIREALADGRMNDLPALGITASIDLPNPIGASYFWAAITTIDPDPYTATAVVAMANVLVAACAYAIARKQAGELAGLAAGVLAATNPWSNWVARGAWLQGSIETFSALALWLVYTGVISRSDKRIIAAGALVAAAMQTYLVAFGLMAQLAGAFVISRWTRRASRGWFIALSVCAISLALFAGVVAAHKTPGTFGNPVNPPQRTDWINLDPINHALRLASGRDFENTFVEADTPNFALRDALSDARATLIDALFGVGLLMLAWRAMRQTAARALLLWAMAPVLGAFVIANFVFKAWEVHVFYIMLGSPAYAVIAAMPFQLQMTHRAWQKTFGGLVLLLVMGCAAVSLWDFSSEVAANVRFPFNHDGISSLLLRDQKQIAAQLKTGCATLSAKEDVYWLASMAGSARAARPGALRAANDSITLSVPASGNLCEFGVNEPAPAFAQTTALSIPGLRRTDHVPLVVDIQRVAASAIPANQNLPTNLGWTLTHFAATPAAKPGEVITVTHAWRVDNLPAEPHDAWYFAPFIKLVDSTGKTWVNLDNAVALQGSAWRVGETMLNTTRFTLPPDAPAGEYTLIASLFDPNQKKNAVYFDSANGNKMILELRQKIDAQSAK